MNTSLFDSIVGLVDALAWPIVAVIVVLMLRKPLAHLIPLIEKIRFKDVEVYFRHLIEQTTSQVAAVSPSLDAPPIDEGIQDLARVYPRGAIIESWILIEGVVVDLAEDRQISIPSSRQKSPRQVVAALEKAGILDKDLAKVIKDLNVIRNGVVHTQDLSPSRSDAQEYIRTAARVIALLEERYHFGH